MLKKFLTNKAYPVIFLAIIVIISVSLLLLISSVTAPVLEVRKAEETKSTLEVIFPEMDSYEIEDEIYVIYRDGEKEGYAFKTSGSGYSGEIDILVGLDTSFKIKGISILSQTETPGLGARIAEDSFTAQFKGIALSEVALKSEGGGVDAITGATISSSAVVDAIRDKMAEVVDELKE
ncbi:MAG: RnfABCDGE type electron transport complex subunit G [Actinomycetota bacterium]|nr:RnfABCDGE type electron transport complex subunit G [Actinomycetota bacterium]